MAICSSNASVFERKSPDVHVEAKREVGLYILPLSRTTNIHPAVVGT